MKKNDEEIETLDFEDNKPSLDDTVEMLDFEMDKKVSNEIDEMLDFLDVSTNDNKENEKALLMLDKYKKEFVESFNALEFGIYGSFSTKTYNEYSDLDMYVLMKNIDDKKKKFINETYLSFIKEFNLTPILITSINDVEILGKYCSLFLLTGGDDINPLLYNEEKCREVFLLWIKL